jgi:hypothetical protein
MQRDALLLAEMIDAAETIRELVGGIDVAQLASIDSAATPCCGTSPFSAKQQLRSAPRRRLGFPRSLGPSHPASATASSTPTRDLLVRDAIGSQQQHLGAIFSDHY